MATRRELREAFYSHLETAADGLVPADNIGQEYPNETEDLPTIIHGDNYRPVPMNTKTGAKDKNVDDVNDIVTFIYSVHMQAQFTVVIKAASEGTKEGIYEAVRSYFEEFTLPIRDASEIQSDVWRVEVLDAASRDDEDREPVSRGDALTVNVNYERLYESDEDGIIDVQETFDIEQ